MRLWWAVLLLCSSSAVAQQVTVSATVTDASGCAYANASGYASLVSGNGSGQQQWLINTTNPVPTPRPIVGIDAFGHFSMQLTNTALIAPGQAAPQWEFRICSFNYPPQQCFISTPIALTANTDLSVFLSSQAPLLPPAACTGTGGGTVTTCLAQFIAGMMPVAIGPLTLCNSMWADNLSLTTYTGRSGVLIQPNTGSAGMAAFTQGPAQPLGIGYGIEGPTSGTPSNIQLPPAAGTGLLWGTNNSGTVATQWAGLQNCTLLNGTIVCGPSQIIGGIMGGNIGTQSPATGNWIGPWSDQLNGERAHQLMPIPAGAWFDKLSIAIKAQNGVSTTNYGFIQTVEQTSPNLGIVSYDYGNYPRVNIITGAAAGSYGQASYIQPFFVGFGLGGSVQMNVSGATGVLPATTGYSWQIVGTTSQILGWDSNGGTVGGGLTRYGGFSYGLAAAITATEALTGIVVPDSFTARNLCINISGAQPVDGSFAVTLRLGASGGAMADTPVVTTVLANAAADTTVCSTGTQALSAGDIIDLKLVNGSASTSTAIRSISMEMVPTGTATGMAIFSTANQAIASGSAKYAAGFVNEALDTTELNQRAPWPRCLTAKNLYCLATTNPGTNPVVITLFKNGAATPVTTSLPTGGCVNNICSDTADSISYAALDTFSLEFNQASGTNPAISSCTIGVY